MESCQYCSKKLEREGKFCNKICSNKSRKGLRFKKKFRENLKCDYCGNSFLFKREHGRIKRFCNKNCSNLNRIRKLKGMKHKHCSIETRVKMSDSHFGKKHPHNCDALRNKPKSKEHKRKLRETFRKLWSDDNYKTKMLQAMRMGHKKSPNKKEQKLDSIIQSIRPNEFIFSGDGKIWIAGKNPDWFNANGKKQVIEFFGDYWHGKSKTGRKKEDEENFYKSHYGKCGYNCLIIWESELLNHNRIMERISLF